MAAPRPGGLHGTFQTLGAGLNLARNVVWTAGTLTTAYGIYQIYQLKNNVMGAIGDAVSAIPNALFGGAADAVNKLDVDQVVRASTEKIKESIKNFDLAGILKEIGEHQNEFREFFHEHGTKWIADMADLTKQSVTGNLPWVALGSVVLTGTPLLLRYAYHWAIDRIGDPKLISERKSYTLLSRMQDAIVNTYAWMAKNVSTYLMTSFKTYGAVVGTTLSTSAAFHFFNTFGAFDPESWMYQTVKGSVIDPFDNMNKDVFCLLDGGKLDIGQTKDRWGYYCSASKDQLLSFNNLALLATSLSTCAILYNNMKALYQHFFVPRPAEGKPIFSKELQSRVDEITSSLGNLKKHGGFLPNVLLYGPGGTGKTMIAKYIARNSGTNYVMMSGGDLAQYIRKGKHVTKLNELMDWIKNQAEPTVLFIDECEALCKNRDRVTRPEDLELVNAFLNHTGEASKKLMLIMATNDKDLDPAVLSRCDYKLPVMPPATPERIKILNKYTSVFFSRWEIKEFFNDEKIEKIAGLTEGLTGRALFKMLNAINNKKKASRNNKLTDVLINETVKNFIEQEKELEAYAKESASQRVTRPPQSGVVGVEVAPAA